MKIRFLLPLLAAGSLAALLTGCSSTDPKPGSSNQAAATSPTQTQTPGQTQPRGMGSAPTGYSHR